MKVLAFDVCQSMDKVHTYFMPFDTQVDPVDSSTEWVYKEVDLCPEHAAELLRQIMKWVGPEMGEHLLGKTKIKEIFDHGR